MALPALPTTNSPALYIPTFFLLQRHRSGSYYPGPHLTKEAAKAQRG